MGDFSTEQDILGHLMEVESAASELALEAQQEADKRRAEAKQKAEAEYRTKYEGLIAELDSWYKAGKEECDAARGLEYKNYAARLESLPKNVEAFNAFVESVFSGK